MRATSKKINKPIPNSRLHDLNDEMLELLVSLYRGRIKLQKIGEKKFNIKKCAKKIDNISRIFGYRSALECLKKDGD